MLTLSQLNTLYQQRTRDASQENASIGTERMNQLYQVICGGDDYYWLEKEYTITTVANQQTYDLPRDWRKPSSIRVFIGDVDYILTEIADPAEFDLYNSQRATFTSDFPKYYHIRNQKLYLYPVPSTSGNTITILYLRRPKPLTIADYTTGTLSATNGSVTLTGSGTAWNTLPGGGSAQLVEADSGSSTVSLNTYTTPTSISETSTNKKSFTAVASGLAAISVSITKGTGNITLVVHDSSDITIASKTIANASIGTSSSVLLRFNFSSVVPITSGSTYHFHIISTVADGLVSVVTAADLSTCDHAVLTEFGLSDVDQSNDLRTSIIDTNGVPFHRYNLTTSINEGATHRQTFVPTKSLLKALTVDLTFFVSGHTITITVHDASNNVVGSASLAFSVFNLRRPNLVKFVFSNPLPLVVGNSYHFHVTIDATSGEGVTTSTTGDLETCTFFTHYVVSNYTTDAVVIIDDVPYNISSINGATSITLQQKYQGSTGSSKSYTIADIPIIPSDFHDILWIGATREYYSIDKESTKMFQVLDNMYKEIEGRLKVSTRSRSAKNVFNRRTKKVYTINDFPQSIGP